MNGPTHLVNATLKGKKLSSIVAKEDIHTFLKICHTVKNEFGGPGNTVDPAIGGLIHA